MSKLTDKDPNKCICHGIGQYQQLSESYTPVYFLGEDDIHQIQPIPIDTIYCPWHSQKGRDAIPYPDGWEPEDLRQWCRDANVPEPEWMEKPPLQFSDLNKLYQETIFYLKGPVFLWKSNYPGGKTISENISWSNQPYATYGNIVVDAPKKWVKVTGWTGGEENSSDPGADSSFDYHIGVDPAKTPAGTAAQTEQMQQAAILKAEAKMKDQMKELDKKMIQQWAQEFLALDKSKK